jgi:hypothetical protein
MKTKAKLFHHPKTVNLINLIIMKLNQAQMLMLSKMHQMDMEFHKEWQKKNITKLYNNNNTNSNLQTWHKSNKRLMQCKCRCKCKHNKKEMEHKNSKMQMNMYKILLKKQAKCQMEIWKRKKNMVKKKNMANEISIVISFIVPSYLYFLIMGWYSLT